MLLKTTTNSLRLSLRFTTNNVTPKFFEKSGGLVQIINKKFDGSANRSFSSVIGKFNQQNVFLLSQLKPLQLSAALATTAPKLSVKTPKKPVMSIQEITKNLHLFTEHPRKIEVDPLTLKVKQTVHDKPLVLMLSWLGAKQAHLKKYAILYIDQGFDVIVASITPWQLLWPTKGTQLVAKDILNFIHNNDYYSQIVIHGFSVGGYLLGEVLVHVTRDMTKYQQTINRIACQIYDSAADITEIPVGVPKALFPRNPRLQLALKQYMLYHMKTFHEAATQHYLRSSQMFHTNLCHAPALFIVSKTDPVGAEQSNIRVRDSWISNGVDITWKCFDKSPHVMHFMKHPEEYVECLFNHLQQANLVRHPERLRAKL